MIGNARCCDCRCEVASRSVKREGRHLTSMETIFSCGARQKDFTNTEAMIGSVELEGCCCARQ